LNANSHEELAVDGKILAATATVRAGSKKK
jgi:hypothetical protein